MNPVGKTSYNYMTDEEQEKEMAHRINGSKIIIGIDKGRKSKRRKFKLNGKEYESIVNASLATGISKDILNKKLKELDETKFSFIDFIVKVPTEYTIEKVKE